MPDRPPLPDSDDPYEILGIDRSATPLDVRRAYVRLIKVFRPERDPAAFQRIHEAYEAIRHEVGSRPSAPREAAPPEAAPAPSESPGGKPDFHEQLIAIWRDLAHGGARATATQDMRSLVASEPRNGLVRFHQFLLEDALEPEGDAVQGLLDELEVGAPFERATLQVTTQEELLRHIDHAALAWPSLRQGEDQEASRWLMSRVIRAQVAAGDLSSAAAHVLSPQYVEDSLSDRTLEATGRHVAAAAAWVDPALAESIWAQFPAGDTHHTSGWTTDDHYETGVRLRAPWTAWVQAHPDHPLLHDFVPVASIASDEVMAPRCTRVHADFLSRPDAYLDALSDMAKRSQDLIDFYSQSIQLQPMDATEPPSAQDQARLERRLTDIERGIAQAANSILGPMLMIGNIMIGILLLGMIGWWVLLITPPAIWLTRKYNAKQEDNVYRKNVRQPLARLITELKLGPRHIVGCMHHTGKYSDLQYYVNLIADDSVLDAIYWTRRLDEPQRVLDRA